MTFVQEWPRTRDSYVLFKGDAFPVSVSAAMQAGGWQGGQGVKWIDSPRDEFLVDYSDGLYGGFMLDGSNESSDQYISINGTQPLYGFGVLCAGGWIISTRTYEAYTLASRLVPPLVPITYTVGERVMFSLRGWWTNEFENPIPGGPYYIGSVVQVPSIDNNYYITLQTSV
jgi:hypothetical protein